MPSKLNSLLAEIRRCQECAVHLPFAPKPVVVARKEARILIIGQAPGTRVHASGVPWDDPSGDRLRCWMGIGRTEFYDPSYIALVPMGFCYPGSGKSGDLPPRKECAPLWHDRVLCELTNVQLTLLVGRYAQAYYLGRRNQATVTETVRGWRTFAPTKLPLPHPSGRNNRWLKINSWFERDVVPYLQRRTGELLSEAGRAIGR